MFAINMEFVSKIKLMGYVSYKAPWLHFKRNTNEYILYFINSGELHIKENGIPYILKQGDMLLLEPNKDHEGIRKHVCDYYYIHFVHPDIKSQLIKDVRELAKQSILEDGSLNLRESSLYYFPKTFQLTSNVNIHHTFHFLHEMRQLYLRKNYNRTLTALRLSELFIRLSRDYLLTKSEGAGHKKTKTFMKAHELLDFIHHFYSQKITSYEIEGKFECNYDYINREFKKVTGHTITRYINKVRIIQAKELLEATNMDIGEIGYLTGFNDPYYFSKVFKMYEGISPLQYYKQNSKYF
ncbi:AraC family transcriptional regulator [Anaerobacillus alkalilacustris]|uniref:AraC family transcriptional regulator n=1 Tax=Anaerobacillus alkalilacustris TaxID=393763 RepID=A0A1S2M1A0_9BACI|nr:AraC family transcriptional regulator [Anaerobacillus alkalilacustris]OIJ17475.1 AraC family transcriptional regulator [Anaerobacillus alkalilacustris]